MFLRLNLINKYNEVDVIYFIGRSFVFWIIIFVDSKIKILSIEIINGLL